MVRRNLGLFETLIRRAGCGQDGLLALVFLEDALNLVVVFVAHLSRATNRLFVITHVHDLVDIVVV